MKRIYIAVGFIAAVIGSVGCVVPLLPTFPFFLLAGVCFAKGSDSLYKRFTSSKLYEKNFKSFVGGKGMKNSTKMRIILSVGVCVGIGFFLSDSIAVKIILTAVFFLHLIYFVFGVKNSKD